MREDGGGFGYGSRGGGGDLNHGGGGFGGGVQTAQHLSQLSPDSAVAHPRQGVGGVIGWGVSDPRVVRIAAAPQRAADARNIPVLHVVELGVKVIALNEAVEVQVVDVVDIVADVGEGGHAGRVSSSGQNTAATVLIQ